jgi:hypothetical protein
MPLQRLAALRGVAPRTLREHLRRLEEDGLLVRHAAGQQGLTLRLTAGSPASTAPSRALLAWPGPDGSGTAAGQGVPPNVVAPAMDGSALRRSIDLLSAAGVYPQVARTLARKPWVTPDLIAAWVYELQSIRAVRHLPAVLAHTLRDADRCLPPPESEPIGPAPAARRPQAVSQEDECAPGASMAEPSGDRAMALALWDAARPALAGGLPQAADTLWLQAAWPLSCADGVLLIAVPTTIGADWLNLSGVPRCRGALEQSLGPSLSLRFVPAGLNDGR